MRLRARGGHVWACRGVGIRQGFCAGTPDGGSVCRQGSGDAAQFCRADLQGEGGGFAGDLRGGVVDGVEDFLDRGSMHPEELRQYARVHRREICLGGGQGIGQLAQDFKRPQRDAPQDDAALGLTLRRQHGPVVAFFACRGMNLYAHTLGRVSKCYVLGQRRKSPHACLLDYAQQKGAATAAPWKDMRTLRPLDYFFWSEEDFNFQICS